jgi:hypothetical protein
MTLTPHRTRDLCSLLDPLSPWVDPSTKPSHTLCTQHYYNMHRALTVTQTSDHIDPTYALSHRLDRASFLTWPRPLFIHRKRPKQGLTSLSHYNIPKKPKKVPQKVVRSVISASLCTPSSTGSQSTKWSTMTKYSSKLG